MAKAKTASLQDVMNRAAEAAAPAATVRATKTAEKGQTRMIGAHLPPEYARRLKILSATHEIQITDLVREGLDYVFKKYGG